MSENDWLQEQLRQELQQEMNQILPPSRVNFQAIAPTLIPKRRQKIMIGRTMQFITATLLLAITLAGILLFQFSSEEAIATQPDLYLPLKTYDQIEIEYTFDYPAEWNLVNIETIEINEDTTLTDIIFESRPGTFDRLEIFQPGDQSAHIQFFKPTDVNSEWEHKDLLEIASTRTRPQGPTDTILSEPKPIQSGDWFGYMVRYHTESSHDVPFAQQDGELIYLDEVPSRDRVFIVVEANQVRIEIYGYAAVGESEQLASQLETLLTTVQPSNLTHDWLRYENTFTNMKLVILLKQKSLHKAQYIIHLVRNRRI